MYVAVEDVLGTKYIINAFYGKFRAFLNEAVENGFGIDLRDCMLGPQCESLLRQYYGKLEMINSTNEYMNEILEFNSNQVKLVFEEYPQLVFPEELNMASLMELNKSVQAGDKYKI